MVHVLKLNQYLQMWNWIKTWQKNHNTTALPNYVRVKSLNIGLDRIYKNTYMNMYKRVKEYQKKHNGTMPQLIGVEKDIKPDPPLKSKNNPEPQTHNTKLPMVPPLNLPNHILPDHTVSIDNIGFYAETPDLTEPFTRTNYDKIEIENGPPRYYPTNTTNREMNFKVTLIKELPSKPYQHTNGQPNFQELLKNIQQCQGIHQFSSIYIGSFTALITIKINDFKPGTATANFNIQEITQ